MNDLVNGLFEFAGAMFILNHCRVLFKAKAVAGVSILSTVFFAVWGLWNVFYYPSLNQWYSFVGGLFIVAGNALWIGMMVFYAGKQTR